MSVVTDRKRGAGISAGAYTYYLPAVLSSSDYYAFGLEMQERTFNSSSYRYGFNTQEKSPEIRADHFTAEHWEYDSRTGRRWNQDPVPFAEESPYATNKNNPIENDDPDGDCPPCLIGAAIGGVFGGGIEIATQLYKNGKVSDWTAVGGSTVQGMVTGAVAGATGGASFLVTAAAAGGANAVGGAVNNTIQGKPVTVTSVVTDATVGAVFGVAGKYVGGKIAAAQKTGKAASASSVTSKGGKALNKSEMTKLKGGAGGNQNGSDISLKYKSNWNTAQKAEADLKVKALNDDVSTFVNKQITRKGNQRSVYEKSTGQTLDKSKDADHLKDLQLGGVDNAGNLWGLDKSVNRSLGEQINNATKDLPHGTKINNVTIH